MKRSIVLLAAAVMGMFFPLRGGSVESKRTSEPGIFKFVSSLCGAGKATRTNIGKSVAYCDRPGLKIQLAVVGSADQTLPGNKPQAREQVTSCLFLLQRTQTLSPGVSSDVDFVGVTGRLVFRDLVVKRGDVLVFRVFASLPDVGEEPKGSASLSEVRRVLASFDSGAKTFFAPEEFLRPVDC
jgi:hypothetical protein